MQQLLDAQQLRPGCWLSATRVEAKNVQGQNAYRATKHTQLRVTAAAPAAAAANKVLSREHEAGSCAAYAQQPQQRPPLVPIHQHQQQPSSSRQTQGDSQATIKYMTQPPA